jgi:hypothetical protein
MSHILEALKKLEQKREQEEPPKLFIFSHAPRPERKERLLWPYVLVGVLLLNAVAMIWWVSLGERQGVKGDVITEKQALPRESPAPRAAQGLMSHAQGASGTAVPDVPQLRAAKAVETERTQAQPEGREEKKQKDEWIGAPGK